VNHADVTVSTLTDCSCDHAISQCCISGG